MSTPEDDYTFYVMTNPGHWCPKCGQEQPLDSFSDPGCPECYTFEEYENGKSPISESQGVTRRDRIDLLGMWRHM